MKIYSFALADVKFTEHIHCSSKFTEHYYVDNYEDIDQVDIDSHRFLDCYYNNLEEHYNLRVEYVDDNYGYCLYGNLGDMKIRQERRI